MRVLLLSLSLQVMTMMFEVQDLAVASPATVSRCGMVYLEPSILGLKPFVECWLRRIPKALENHGDKLEGLFDKFLEASKCPCYMLLCKMINLGTFYEKETQGDVET